MFVASLLCQIAPRSVWRHRIKTWKLETGEAEQGILPSLCDRHKLSVDVGAADGTYTARMLLHSSRVVAFEPNPQACAQLRKQFQDTRLVSVENVALSDEPGIVEMRIPADRPMLGTIEKNNLLPDSNHLQSIPVQRRTLDDYDFQPVGFLKIDVEGHEISVLNGAQKTIERNRPKLVIEVDKSHLDAVSSFFSRLNYSAFFLLEGSLLPLDRFNASVHQDPANLKPGYRIGCYINNFVFLPQDS